jgi:hypothetical protein
MKQGMQLQNPDSRITFSESKTKVMLSDYADTFEGLTTGDLDRFVGLFWEQGLIGGGWSAFIGNVTKHVSYAGRQQVIYWENGVGALAQSPSSYIKGERAWGEMGLRISQTGNLVPTIYTGELFDKNAATLIPFKAEHLLPIYCFTQSALFTSEVRNIDQALKVTIKTLVKIPFDLKYWQAVAEGQYPEGLPKPFSSDPAQWLFNGHPHKSDNPLQVAVARLLCYQWPRQTGSSFTDCPALGADGLEMHADDDGIVALSSINREEAAAPRLRALLNDAYGAEWQEGITERQLLADAGHGDSTLEEWLRDSFFEEHCKLFHHRPFVWHICDGERDGFHALVNYHRLAAPSCEGARLLQNLAQT